MKIVIELLAAFIMVLTFGILFQAPKKSLLLLGFTGAISWSGYVVSMILIDNVVVSVFIASIMVGICGEIFSRIMRIPVTVFVINGIIPLVPGISVYDTMFFLIKGKYIEGVKTGIDTILIGGAIALAIAIVSTLAKYFKKIKNKKKKLGV